MITFAASKTVKDICYQIDLVIRAIKRERLNVVYHVLVVFFEWDEKIIQKTFAGIKKAFTFAARNGKRFGFGEKNKKRVDKYLEVIE